MVPRSPAFALACCAFILSATAVLAQSAMESLENIIPPSPTAASLGKYGNTPVTYYTGTPGISIPLYEIQGRRLSLPVSLSYHASGIRVEEIPGWVGLGWTLNAGGAITRTVRDKPDDEEGGYFHTTAHRLESLKNDLSDFHRWTLPADRSELLDYYLTLSRNWLDTEPDLYFFNFNGKSGKLIFNPEGGIHTIPHQNLLVRPIKGVNNRITSWLIVDEQGTRYLFGTEEGNEITTYLASTGNPESEYISSWYLVSVTSSNRDDNITLSYQDYSSACCYPVPLSKRACKPLNDSDLRNYSQTRIQGKYLSNIRFSLGQVQFRTSDLGGYVGGKYTCLTEIFILNLQDAPVKKFRLEYSFFTNIGEGSFEDYLRPSKRIRLDRLREFGSDGASEKPPHYFFYNSRPLPPRGSFSQDLWGFYNGRPNENLLPAMRVINHDRYHSLPPFETDEFQSWDHFGAVNIASGFLEAKEWIISGADRSPSGEYMKAGMLEKIAYPTGGYTVFDYEPHDFSFITRPRKPERSRVSASWADDRCCPVDSTAYLSIPFAQTIRVIPLFYILEGSLKDRESRRPGLNSMVIIKSKPIVPETPSVEVFRHTYLDRLEESGGWEAEYELFLESGLYEIQATAAEKGDYTVLLAYSAQGSPFDGCYPIYEDEHKVKSLQAGMAVWPDDTSAAVSKTLRIRDLDKSLVHLDYYFYTRGTDPRYIPGRDYPIPWSLMQVRDSDSPDRIVFRKYFADIYPDSIRYDSKARKYFLKGSASLNLTPGTYLVEFIPRIKTECGMITITYDEWVERHYRKAAGGLRVRSITDFDNLGDTLSCRRFRYSMQYRDREISSGVLLPIPLFYDQPEEFYYGARDNAIFSFGCFPLRMHTTNRNQLGSTQGSHIGYRQVDVVFPDSGTIRYTYTSPYDYPDISDLRFPYSPPVSFDHKRGLPLEVSYFSSSGILRKKEEFEYNFFSDDTVNRAFIPALKTVKRDPGSIFPVIRKYQATTGWNYTSKITETMYDTEGERAISVVKGFDHDPRHLQQVRSTTQNSNGSLIETRSIYPPDLPVSYSAANDSLVARHVVSSPVRKETFENSMRTSGERTTYGLFGTGSMVLPESFDILEGEDYRTSVVVDRYDDFGNVLQYHQTNDIHHAINWDENGIFPVQKTGNSIYFPDTAQYPAGLPRTKYYFTALVGLDSVVDPNGRTSRYTYDSFQRLAAARDFEMNLLSMHDYHYKGYQGDTTRPAGGTIPVYSLPPDTALAYPPEIDRNCSALLQISGGLLAPDAEWIWYSDSSLTLLAGTGTSMVVSPLHSTTYFVRAEGSVNISPFRSVRVSVRPAFIDLAANLFTCDWKGTADQPVFVAYSGCDRFHPYTDQSWLRITGYTDDQVNFSVAENLGGSVRKAYLAVQGAGISDSLVVEQYPKPPPPVLTLSYQPGFVQPGTAVHFLATVEYGTTPCSFTWERRPVNQSAWTVVRNSGPLQQTTDALSLIAGPVDFDVRCTVITAGTSLTRTIRVVVAQ